MSGDTGLLEEARAAERHDGIRQVFEDGSATGTQVDDLGGEVALRPIEVRSSLSGDVNGGVRAAVDVDPATVAVDETVSELLHEHECHLGQVRVEVDRPVRVERRLLE